MKKLVEQVRKPKGRFGRLVAKMMNRGGHAKLANWGLSFIKIDSISKILDIGCGGGANVNKLAAIAKDGKVFGIDYSEDSIEVSKKVNEELIRNERVEIKRASVSSLPFEADSFDLVTAFEVSYFFPDLINDLKGIYKILKNGGRFLLVNEGYMCKNEKKRKTAEKYAKIGNFDIHTPEEYENFLSSASFSSIEIHEEEKEGWIAVIGVKS